MCGFGLAKVAAQTRAPYKPCALSVRLAAIWHQRQHSAQMKKPSAYKPFPTPKRGKGRLMAKRPSHAAANGTPYVRHGTKTKKARPEREKWSVNLKTILGASEDGTVARLTDIGILEDKTGKTCPFCK